MDSEFIFHCGCGDTESFSKMAFKIAFPDRALPLTTADPFRLPEAARPTARALMRSGRKFAIYYGEDQVFDLLKGVRLA